MRVVCSADGVGIGKTNEDHACDSNLNGGAHTPQFPEHRDCRCHDASAVQHPIRHIGFDDERTFDLPAAKFFHEMA
jgi:hypothetical protein